MSILALDLSLTAAGWARSDGTSGVFTPPTEFARGVDRLRWHRWAVTRILADIKLAVLEGYAFNRINQAHQLGELGGVIRCALADHDIPYIEVPPASLKLFATGKGNAKKEQMLDAAIRKLSYAGNDHNEADALWLLAMAQAFYWSPIDALSNEERRGIDGTKWPKLSREALGAVSRVDVPAPMNTIWENVHA